MAEETMCVRGGGGAPLRPSHKLHKYNARRGANARNNCSGLPTDTSADAMLQPGIPPQLPLWRSSLAHGLQSEQDTTAGPLGFVSFPSRKQYSFTKNFCTDSKNLEPVNSVRTARSVRSFPGLSERQRSGISESTTGSETSRPLTQLADFAGGRYQSRSKANEIAKKITGETPAMSPMRESGLPMRVGEMAPAGKARYGTDMAFNHGRCYRDLPKHYLIRGVF
eukprot:GEMP01079561.1.p1 GENE.GEMP01079561.1~~GEMP01079561.1.p1  ORF type:complete len:223 (+),score=32.33 GEMP01079561.1:71-739(+)